MKKLWMWLFLFSIAALPGWAQTIYVNGATAANPGACIVVSGGTTVCYGGKTQASALLFGSTSRPLSATAPSTGQFLEWDGSHILGASASGVGACSAGKYVTGLNNAGAPTCAYIVPFEVATSDLTAQAAAISATTIYAVGAGGVGAFRVSFVAKLTTPAGTSSILGGAGGFQVIYTDQDSVTVTTPVETYNSDSTTLALNTTQAVYSGTIVVYAKSSSNIQYKLGYTSVTGAGAAMAYELSVRVETM